MLKLDIPEKLSDNECDDNIEFVTGEDDADERRGAAAAFDPWKFTSIVISFISRGGCEGTVRAILLKMLFYLTDFNA